VSGSPTGFYPRIRQTLAYHRLPRGPVILKDFGSDALLDQWSYKLRQIEMIIRRLPQLRFILVGDSGEQDPEVYRAIAARHPGRIAGIVIRLVPGSDTRSTRFESMHQVDDFAGMPELLAGIVRRAQGF
jgi:phosphatidate phosphatase APP1